MLLLLLFSKGDAPHPKQQHRDRMAQAQATVSPQQRAVQLRPICCFNTRYPKLLLQLLLLQWCHCWRHMPRKLLLQLQLTRAAPPCSRVCVIKLISLPLSVIQLMLHDTVTEHYGCLPACLVYD